jgi:excisionase family DNA binding protein
MTHANKKLSTKEASAIAGVSVQTILLMIKTGRLLAQRMGRDWFINSKDLAQAKFIHSAGRPRKKEGQAKGNYTWKSEKKNRNKLVIKQE